MSNNARTNEFNINKMLQILKNTNQKESHLNSKAKQQPDVNVWASHARQSLKQTEQRELSTRVEVWTNLVNESTKSTSKKLRVAQQLRQFKPSGDLKLSQYTSFMNEWKPSSTPRSFDECYQQASDWLQSVKASKYSHSLLPDLVRLTEKHSSGLSHSLFKGNEHKRDLCTRCIMYDVLHRAIDARFMFDNSSCHLVADGALESCTDGSFAQAVSRYAEEAHFHARCPARRRKASFFADKFRRYFRVLTSPSSTPALDDAHSAASSVFSAASASADMQKQLMMPSLQDPDGVRALGAKRHVKQESKRTAASRTDERAASETGCGVAAPSRFRNKHVSSNAFVSNASTPGTLTRSSSSESTQPLLPTNSTTSTTSTMSGGGVGGSGIAASATADSCMDNSRPHMMKHASNSSGSGSMSGGGSGAASLGMQSPVPLLTFTNQQHKMILHLLNQLIATYNSQQMNIVYLNNRVRQLESALAKQTAKVQAVEMKVKHSYSHHSRRSASGASASSSGSSTGSRSGRPRAQYRSESGASSSTSRERLHDTTNESRMTMRKQLPNVANMPHASKEDMLPAQQVRREHNIELKQLLSIVQPSSQQAQQAQQVGAASNAPQHVVLNATQDMFVNANLNGMNPTSGIQMHIPIAVSSDGVIHQQHQQTQQLQQLQQQQRGNNQQANLQGIVNFLNGLQRGSATAQQAHVQVQPPGLGINGMNGINGINGINVVNAINSASVANPLQTLGRSQAMMPPLQALRVMPSAVLGGNPQQSGRKRLQSGVQSQPTSKRRKMDHSFGAYATTGSVPSNSGAGSAAVARSAAGTGNANASLATANGNGSGNSIINNPMMLQMLFAQVNNNNNK